MVQWFRFQETPSKLVAWADSDYAACRSTRKSTSGGCLMFGSHAIRTWSSTQSVVALSVGEAEYSALVKAGCAALGLQSVAGDMGLSLEVELNTDSSSAKGVAGRLGLGKTRHIAVHLLWLQEKARNQEVRIRKVPTSGNLADLMTKIMDANRTKQLLELMGCWFTEGQNDTCPRLA